MNSDTYWKVWLLFQTKIAFGAFYVFTHHHLLHPEYFLHHFILDIFSLPVLNYRLVSLCFVFLLSSITLISNRLQTLDIQDLFPLPGKYSRLWDSTSQQVNMVSWMSLAWCVGSGNGLLPSEIMTPCGPTSCFTMGHLHLSLHRLLHIIRTGASYFV